ncbi:ABC transporter permease [Treponema sp. OttesenSCG-928-L16]|nr:ABC transporter permease [Treponema sp. OttesenSCG-928-L16]
MESSAQYIDSGTDYESAGTLKSESFGRKALRRFLRHKLAVCGIIIFTLILLGTIFIPIHNMNAAFDLNFMEISKKPSRAHWLGTDSTGRDIFIRLMLGGRVSLAVGFVSVVFSAAIGIVLGGLAGYMGGKVDMIIMRFTDTVMCFPFLIIAMTLVTVLGPSVVNTIIAIALLNWCSTARITRGQFLSLREQQFIEADRCLGIKDRKIIFAHILPNALSPIIVNTTFNMANAIMSEASLSFLGLGVSLPTPSWGNMLKDASSLVTLRTMPWVWIPAGLMIALTVLSINFIGDGLRDALDPRMDL